MITKRVTQYVRLIRVFRQVVEENIKKLYSNWFSMIERVFDSASKEQTLGKCREVGETDFSVVDLSYKELYEYRLFRVSPMYMVAYTHSTDNSAVSTRDCT